MQLIAHLSTDQEINEPELSKEKQQKKTVKFSEDSKKPEDKQETNRNFYMMDHPSSAEVRPNLSVPSSEVRPNFLVGCEDGNEDVEEKDVFPQGMVTGMLTKQLSNADLIDKRRRLR